MTVEARPMPPSVSAAVRTCRAHIAGAIAFSALINLLYLAPTIYMMQVYDRAVPTGGQSTLLFLTAMVLLALATLAVLDAARSWLLILAGWRLDRKLAPLLIQLELEQGAGGRHPLRTFDQLRLFLSSSAVPAILDAPWAPLYIVAAFLIHPALGLFILGGGILLVLIALAHGRAARARPITGLKGHDSSHAAINNCSLAGEALRAMGMVAPLRERYLANRTTEIGALASSQQANAIAASFTKFVRLALQSSALGLGAWLAMSQQISAGSIIAASVLMSRALQPVEQIVGSWQTIAQARRAWLSLASQLPSRPEILPMPLPDPTGRLTIEQMTYRYTDTGPVVLRQLTFHIEPGELLVIAGPSGAGKSMLASILAGAAHPTLGTVRLDGASLADWPSDALGRHIGYLPQQPSLVAGSIRDNISRFADWRGADSREVAAQVVDVAIAAGVHPEILGLPQGYDTMLGAGGVGLSAGQAQRVALARAYYGTPALLVLDEPDAAQDIGGERVLMDTLAAHRARGAAVVVVAHRGPIMTIADRLLLLRGGRIEQIGTPAELLGDVAQAAGYPAPVDRRYAGPGIRGAAA